MSTTPAFGLGGVRTLVEPVGAAVPAVAATASATAHSATRARTSRCGRRRITVVLVCLFALRTSRERRTRLRLRDGEPADEEAEQRVPHRRLGVRSRVSRQ